MGKMIQTPDVHHARADSRYRDSMADTLNSTPHTQNQMGDRESAQGAVAVPHDVAI